MLLHSRKKQQFLLVEPVAKTPYPPLGLMKIASMLKRQNPEAEVISQVGLEIPPEAHKPEKIYVTSLFTWDLKHVVSATNLLKRKFPSSEIMIGGIAASLMPEYVTEKTGIAPHVGLLNEAENEAPDYSFNFGRKVKSSITFTSRGCIRKCSFCTVKSLEPEFIAKADWEKDINHSYQNITFWDNNWLASPNLSGDIKKLLRLNKRLDFNQGLDARLYDRSIATALSSININPIRFAFDDLAQEQAVVQAITLAKEITNKEISVYVLYNFNDTPEEFYYKIDTLNRLKVLSFPMGYRAPFDKIRSIPSKGWNEYLLRALKLSLLFYYRRGMITESRASFEKIYGKTASEFVSSLYRIYEYDKSLKRCKKVTLNV